MTQTKSHCHQWSRFSFRSLVGLILPTVLVFQTCVSLLPMQAQPATPGVGQLSSMLAKDPSRPDINLLKTAIDEKKVKFKLSGDGATTGSVKLIMTNLTDKPMKVMVPTNQIFDPGGFPSQTMMSIQDLIVELPPGVTTVANLLTVCASTQTVSPPKPAEEGAEYKIGEFKDKEQWQKLSSIVAAARDLDARGVFDALPIDQARRLPQIMQLAVWQYLGNFSTNPKDKVTPQSMQSDLLDKLSEAVKLNPDLLKSIGPQGYTVVDGKVVPATKERKEQLDNTMAAIFSAVDLTVKRAGDTNLANVAPLPTGTVWDTFADVGERAFARGDYAEAEELLKSAVVEAEKMGEADARLSRSLVSLGKCYLELTGWEDRAEACFTRALSVREKLFGANSVQVAEAATCLGQLKQLQNAFDQANTFFQKANDALEKATNVSPEMMAETLNNLGRNLTLLNETERSIPQLSKALAIAMSNSEKGQPQFGGKGVQVKMKAASVTDSPEVAEIQTNLANAYLKKGDYAEAEKRFTNALLMDVKLLGEQHIYIATILDGLAAACEKQDKRTDAEDWKKKAEAIREKALGKNFKDHGEIAGLPVGYAAMSRMQQHILKSASSSSEMATLKAAANLLPGASADKLKINRPIKDKWALVIGVSKFKDKDLNLQFASKDAKDFAKFLSEKAQFQADHIKVLTDEQATRENILATIGDKWLPRVANPDDLVVIFISSHGSPSEVDVKGANFLLCHNTDKNNLYATGIGMDELTKRIKDRCHSDRVVVFLDACHSGSAQASGKGVFRVKNFDAESIAQGTGQLVVCSSMPTQTSWESTRYPNGVFTHCLMEALQVNGPGTKLKDAYVVLKDKVQEEVIRDRGVQQTPMLKMKWDGDDLILATPPTQVRPALEDDEDKTATADRGGASGTKSPGTASSTGGAKPSDTARGTTAAKPSGAASQGTLSKTAAGNKPPVPVKKEAAK